MCLNTGTPKNHHFSFGTNGKVVFGVPILKHFRVPSYFEDAFLLLFLLDDKTISLLQSSDHPNSPTGSQYVQRRANLAAR